jgi:hypothetical protein
MFCCSSVAFKWLQSAEINFNPDGDAKQLQDIHQFMSARCKSKLVLETCLFDSAGTIFRSKGHSLSKLGEFIEVISPQFLLRMYPSSQTVHPMDENGQPLFNVGMDAQRKAVFKVDCPSRHSDCHGGSLLVRCMQVYLEDESANTSDQRPSITNFKRR